MCIRDRVIEDDGPGFSKDILAKIGEPYIKSLRTKDKQKAGLGLGIFIGKTLLEKNYAKISVEPFDRGYAVTVGNALRRTLLTTLPGAAITSIKIDGVSHEFSTIDGVCVL